MWRRLQLISQRPRVGQAARDSALETPLRCRASPHGREPIDRGGQHDAAQVVDVLADQVHPARRPTGPLRREKAHAAPFFAPAGESWRSPTGAFTPPSAEPPPRPPPTPPLSPPITSPPP